MAIKTKDEIMNAVKERLGEDTSDEALTLIEDLSDTIDNLSDTQNDGTDWKTRYEQNDAQWRQRYRDRFFNQTVQGNDEPEEPVEPEEKAPMTFNELFKGE